MSGSNYEGFRSVEKVLCLTTDYEDTAAVSKLLGEGWTVMELSVDTQDKEIVWVLGWEKGGHRR